MGDTLSISGDLLWIALVIGVLAAIIAMREVSPLLAIGLAAVRVAIPLLYFTLYADSLWVELDDVTYFEQGQNMLDNGYTPLTAIIDPSGFDLLKVMSGGPHVLYGWWNLLAQYLFGDHYYAAVFLNVLLTFVCAHLLAKIACDLGFSPAYRTGLYIFFLLHWDILVWSSLINLKDILVLTMTVTTLFCGLRLQATRQPRYAAGLLALLVLFRFIRFYVPVLMSAAMLFWLVTHWRDARKYFLFAAGMLAVYVMAPPLDDLDSLVRLSDLATGAVHFTITPAPWRLEEGSFLFVPAIMHWAMMFPAIVGGVILWRTTPTTRLFMMYLVIAIAFYAVVEELRGPRPRVQLLFFVAWMQYQFFWSLATASAGKWRTVVTPALAPQSIAWPVRAAS